MRDALPESLNVAAWFLDARIAEGRGDRVALRTEAGTVTYAEVHALANQWAHRLSELGVVPEQRVLVALPDSSVFVGVFFGALKLGAVAVMLNPDLKPEALGYQFQYTRAAAVVIDQLHLSHFVEATKHSAHRPRIVVADDLAELGRVGAMPVHFDTFASHRDDAAIWLYSGGTTGHPKGVVQTHGAFVNTTRLYAHGVLKMTEDDITLAVPKLFFGYATGANLLFPFSVGASAVLFPGRSSADALFAQIERHRPTVLINVPTVVNQMVSHPEASAYDLSSLRLATSAGEALPVELYHRWKARFGVELLDGLGTAEMWHVFLTNHPGAVKPGSLGTVVDGFEVRICDDDGRELPRGETGWLYVKGDSRALGYWQNLPQTMRAFRGEWYVSGDMLRQDEEGFFHYCGRGDDMLKVAGRWLSPQEVEDCLQAHEAVREVAVVGVTDATGLVKPHAFVVPTQWPAETGLDETLRQWAGARLDGFKVPRRVSFLEAMPRTHLGKIDRGLLRKT